MKCGACLAFALLLFGCNAQIYPRPMESATRNLPPGASGRWSAGPEEVTVVRHADPVRLRAPGSTGGVPVQLYEKNQRAQAGTGVITAAGGKAEVIWPLGTSVILFGPATGVIGSAGRGEPTFVFEELGRARLDLREEDVVQLMGGALISGPSGPYLLDRILPEVVRVTNQSKMPMNVAFRSSEFELGPGQRIDLPLVSSGGAPEADTADFQTVSGPGFSLLARGEVAARASDSGIDVEALGVHEVRALGVRLQLEPGETARFSGLDGDRVEPPVVEEPAPEAPSEPPPNAAESEGAD